MRSELVEELEQEVNQKSHNNAEHNKQQRLDDNINRLCVGGTETDYEGKYNYSDYIVDNCGGHDNCADAPFKMPELTERLNRDTDGGCRHNRADKHSAEKLVRADRREAEEQAVQKPAEYKRHKNARAGYREGNRTCFDELFQIRFKSRREHEQNHADFR